VKKNAKKEKSSEKDLPGKKALYSSGGALFKRGKLAVFASGRKNLRRRGAAQRGGGGGEP